VPHDSGCTFLLTCTTTTVTRKHLYTNRLPVVNKAGATAPLIPFRLQFPTEPSAPSYSATYRVPPRPWMVARDSSRIFSNAVDPFD
jgi:hypothetical protein